MVKVTVQVFVTVVRFDVIVVELVVEMVVVVVVELVELVVEVEFVEVVEDVEAVDVEDVDVVVDVVDVVEGELAWTASTNQIADSPGLSAQFPDETWF